MQNYIDKIINNVVGYGLTYKQKFNKKYGFNKNDSHNIKEISKLTKYKKEGLETIYDKGIGAYHSNPESVRPQVHSPEQWAMARIYASINPSSKASKVDKSHLISGGKINFHKIHWGAFTKQFNNRKNKRLKNFKEFSNYILKHPDEFNKITKKRANFYKNFIFGRGIIGCGKTRPVTYNIKTLEQAKKYNEKLEKEGGYESDDFLDLSKFEPIQGIITNTIGEEEEVFDSHDNPIDVHLDAIGTIDNAVEDVENVLQDEDIDYYDLDNLDIAIKNISKLDDYDISRIDELIEEQKKEIREEIEEYEKYKNMKESKYIKELEKAKSQYEMFEAKYKKYKDEDYEEKYLEYKEKYEKLKNRGGITDIYDKLALLEEKQDKFLDSRIIYNAMIKNETDILEEEIKDSNSDVLQILTEPLKDITFIDEPITIETPVEENEKIVEFTKLSRNHDIAISRIKNILEEYNLPEKDERELLREAVKSGQSFEYDITGSGNRLAQILFQNENVDVQVNNFLIKKIANESMDVMKEKYPDEDLSFLKGSADSFFIDTSCFNIEEAFINECKDNFDKNSISELKFEQENMKKIFEELEDLLKNETNPEIIKQLEDILDEDDINSSSFKEYYYKYHIVYYEKVQPAKFYGSKTTPYMPNYDENWNFTGITPNKGNEKGNKKQKIIYEFNKLICDKFNENFIGKQVSTLVSFLNKENAMQLNLSKNNFCKGKNLIDLFGLDKAGWIKIPYTELSIIKPSSYVSDTKKLKNAKKQNKEEYETKSNYRRQFEFEHFQDKINLYKKDIDEEKKKLESKGKTLTFKRREQIAKRHFSKGLEVADKFSQSLTKNIAKFSSKK